MFQKLDDVVLKHKELTEKLMDPEVVSDPKKIMEYNKALNSIDEVVQKYTHYKNRKEEMESLKEDLKVEKDSEMKEMMLEEIHSIEEEIPQLEEELKSFKQPSLKKALNQKGIQIIGEFKRASPSKGKISNDDFDLLKQAQSYVDKGVAAFSILTEKEYFKGENDFIKIVREKFPEMPILRKDFIYTPFQVAHAKFLGASAILLIVRMLDDKTLLELHKLAQDLEMDVLVETHDEEEIRRALKIPNLEILGINNRNLNTFEVDIRTTEKLINEIPSDVLNNLTIVSESGFLSKEDVEYAEKLNVDGLLIGEALMKGLL